MQSHSLASFSHVRRSGFKRWFWDRSNHASSVERYRTCQYQSIVRSSYPRTRPLTAGNLRPKTSSTGSYHGYFAVCSTDASIVVSDFNAQLGHLAETEGHTRSRFSSPADRTDNIDRLVYIYPDHKLFLVTTNFNIKSIYGRIWRPPSPSQRWGEINHTAVGHQ